MDVDNAKERGLSPNIINMGLTYQKVIVRISKLSVNIGKVEKTAKNKIKQINRLEKVRSVRGVKCAYKYKVIVTKISYLWQLLSLLYLAPD
jgi:hypothetical protein